MDRFRLFSSFSPKGSQPEAIEKLTAGIISGEKFQTLLGVTGSGKTFTMANVIEQVQMPTLIMAHNKTLAAQLYRELKELFPENRVEYFVSYYDYYQPESYIAHKDLYIEKDAKINEKIEKMRLSATASLLSKKSTIVVASVSAIYGAGNPENFQELGIELECGQKIERNELLTQLLSAQFERNDIEKKAGSFSVRGGVVDISPGYLENFIRVELFDGAVERISEHHKITGELIKEYQSYFFYPAKHFVMTKKEINRAIDSIKDELKKQLPKLGLVEAHRLKQRTLFDIEMIEELGYCNGIENYSRHFDGRKKGERPFCLLDYFPEDFLLIIDESHQSIPQIRGMFKGDRSRKKSLVEHGFRLPSALDNRPLKFEEFEKFMKHVVFVSATPGEYELERSQSVVEQIIRPTGLIDPPVSVRSSKGQIKDAITEIRKTIDSGHRILLTTLTKRLAEELSEFLAKEGIKTRYLHSEIDTLERDEIINDLRRGEFDVLVGINLLREGLDIPEVALIAIFDADKEGFLRDAKSLIQTIGRAARNSKSRVILYADKITDSMKKAISETERRRKLQIEHNLKNNITPQTIKKPIPEKEKEIKDIGYIPKTDLVELIPKTEEKMRKAAKELDFEKAILFRERVKLMKSRLEES